MSTLTLDKYSLKSEVEENLPTVITDIDNAVSILDSITPPDDLPCLNEYNSFESDMNDIKKKMDHLKDWFSTSVTSIDSTSSNTYDNIKLLPDNRVTVIGPRLK